MCASHAFCGACRRLRSLCFRLRRLSVFIPAHACHCRLHDFQRLNSVQFEFLQTKLATTVQCNATTHIQLTMCGYEIAIALPPSILSCPLELHGIWKKALTPTGRDKNEKHEILCAMTTMATTTPHSRRHCMRVSVCILCWFRKWMVFWLHRVDLIEMEFEF